MSTENSTRMRLEMERRIDGKWSVQDHGTLYHHWIANRVQVCEMLLNHCTKPEDGGYIGFWTRNFKLDPFRAEMFRAMVRGGAEEIVVTLQNRQRLTIDLRP